MPVAPRTVNDVSYEGRLTHDNVLRGRRSIWWSSCVTLRGRRSIWWISCVTLRLHRISYKKVLVHKKSLAKIRFTKKYILQQH